MSFNGSAWGTKHETLAHHCPSSRALSGVRLGTTITVSVGATSETWTLSDTDQQKFEAWVQVAYKCAPVPPATTCTTVLTDVQGVWAKATLQGTANNVDRFQDTVAATAAVNAITPIGFSVGATKKRPISPSSINGCLSTGARLEERRRCCRSLRWFSRSIA